MMICGTLITPDITLLTRRRTALKRISEFSAKLILYLIKRVAVEIFPLEFHS